jgi:hypothetical protein
MSNYYQKGSVAKDHLEPYENLHLTEEEIAEKYNSAQETFGFIDPDKMIAYANALYLINNPDSETDIYKANGYNRPVTDFKGLLKGGNLKLSNDIDDTYTISFKEDTKLDLNGKSISSTLSDTNSLQIAIDGCNVTVSNGTIKDPVVIFPTSQTDHVVFQTNNGSVLTVNNLNIESDHVFWANEGTTIIINSGDYKASQYGNVAYSVGGKIIINGGTFEEYNAGQKSNDVGVLNIQDSYTKIENAKPTDYIEVFGGRFIKYNPANVTKEPGFGLEYVSYVAEGYESVEVEENVWEVRKIEDIQE